MKELMSKFEEGVQYIVNK